MESRPSNDSANQKASVNETRHPMDIFELTPKGIIQYGPCPYCGNWNCSHDGFPPEIERRNNILNPPKPYTGEDKRTNKEIARSKVQSVLWR